MSEKTSAEERRARNRRTALVLGGIAFGFFIALFVRMAFFGR